MIRTRSQGTVRRGRPSKFPQVKQRLRAAILQGRLSPDEQLPTFHEVARTMRVGSVTAKRAIDELVEEGWLRAQQGVGTFVNSRASIAPIVLTISSRNNPLYHALEPDVLEEFHERHPGIRVMYSAEADTDLIVGSTYAMIVQAVRGPHWHALDALRTQLGLPAWELTESTRRMASWRNDLYGLPLQLNLNLFQFNPALLQRCGLAIPDRYLDWNTFEEILDRCRGDADGDGVNERFGALSYLHTSEWLLPFWQNGGRLDDREAFFSDAAIRAIDRVFELTHVVKSYPFEAPISSGEMYLKQVRKRFDAGNVALRLVGIREIFHQSPFPSGMLLPRFGPVARHVTDGTLLAITRDCPHPDVAMKFLDFCYQRYVRENAGYPFALKASQREILLQHEEKRELLQECIGEGMDPLQEGRPERTWAIENEISQWFRLFQDRTTTMRNIREAWRRFPGSRPAKAAGNAEFGLSLTEEVSEGPSPQPGRIV